VTPGAPYRDAVPSPPGSTSNRSSTSTVGRDAEHALLHARVSDLAAGRGGVVVLAGEPGIGKTRLALDAAEHARAHDLTVAWGRCREAGSVPPFWPWVQVLRDVVRAEGADALRARLGPAAGDVLALAGDGPAPAGGADALGPSRRIRLYDAVAQLLAGVTRPVLAVVDDVHRADESSLALLRFLAGEELGLPLLLLVTYRPTELPRKADLAATLAALGSGPASVELALAPLTPAAARLVAGRAGGRLPDADLAAVVARGGGNPFFLQQLGRAVASGAPPGWVPASVQEVIRRRLAGLPARCRELLEVLAVAGRRASVAVVARAAGTTPGDLLTALLPAAAGGLLSPTGSGELQFLHALVQETLYADLAPGTRAELHERLADALAGSATGDPHAAAEIAEHALQAARGGRPCDPVPALRAAACAAVGSLAPEEAARLLELALEECRATGLRGQLLRERGQALLSAGRPADARACFTAAAEAAQEDAGALAAAALGVGACVVPVGEADWALVRLLRSALAALPGSEAALRVRLRARLAVELYWADGATARRESAQALAEPEGAGGAGLPDALQARLFTLRGPDGVGERLALARRLIGLAQVGGDEDAELRAWAFSLQDLLRIADLPAYRAGVDRVQRLADRSRQPLHRWYAEVFAAQRALVSGAVAEAAELGAAAQRLARRLGVAAGDVYAVGLQAALSRDVGGGDELPGMLAATADRFPGLLTMRMLHAVALAQAGRRPEAAGQLAGLAADRFSGVPRDSLWLATLCLGAEAAEALRDRGTAAVLAELLAPYRGSCAVQGVPVVWGAVDRALGLARLACGDAAGARADLAAAVELHERWGMPVLAARARLDLARALATASGGGSPAAAAEAGRVRAEAAELGLDRLAQQAGELAAAWSGPPDAGPRVAGPGGVLTARELDVLRLVAAGRSNRAIAEALFISLNTVERHVRDVYGKLDVPNRAAATAHAVRAGLTYP
jgi:DNA-binding CsgD family transcriptional regulator